MDYKKYRPVRRVGGAGAGAEHAGGAVPPVPDRPPARRQAGACQHRHRVRPVPAGRWRGAGHSADPLSAGRPVRRQRVGHAVLPAGRRHRHAGDDRPAALPPSQRLRRIRGRRSGAQHRPDGCRLHHAGQHHGAGLPALPAGRLPCDRHPDRLCHRPADAGNTAHSISLRGGTMDKKDQIILQQLDVIRSMTENNVRRMGSDFWGTS